jgi:hypothetical protein
LIRVIDLPYLRAKRALVAFSHSVPDELNALPGLPACALAWSGVGFGDGIALSPVSL